MLAQLAAAGRMDAMPYRIGLGTDIHRLQPGGKLMLAGVSVSTELSPIAHSDGDVVLHALSIRERSETAFRGHFDHRARRVVG